MASIESTVTVTLDQETKTFLTDLWSEVKFLRDELKTLRENRIDCDANIPPSYVRGLGPSNKGQVGKPNPFYAETPEGQGMGL